MIKLITLICLLVSLNAYAVEEIFLKSHVRMVSAADGVEYLCVDLEKGPCVKHSFRASLEQFPENKYSLVVKEEIVTKANKKRTHIGGHGYLPNSEKGLGSGVSCFINHEAYPVDIKINAGTRFAIIGRGAMLKVNVINQPEDVWSTAIFIKVKSSVTGTIYDGECSFGGEASGFESLIRELSKENSNPYAKLEVQI